jgi:hypothetical protein
MSVIGEKFVDAWLRLPETVRDEIADEIAKYKKRGKIELGSISLEKINEWKEVRGATMNLGPVPGGCPLCGK